MLRGEILGFHLPGDSPGIVVMLSPEEWSKRGRATWT